MALPQLWKMDNHHRRSSFLWLSVFSFIRLGHPPALREKKGRVEDEIKSISSHAFHSVVGWSLDSGLVVSSSIVSVLANSYRDFRGGEEGVRMLNDGMEVVVAQEEQDNGSVEFNWGFVFIKTKAIISCSVRWGNHRMNEYLEQLTIIFNSTSSPNILGPWIDGRTESAINQFSGGLSIIIHH